ncbi:N-6 DNA methylase [Jeotgalibacillus marinus]|uniref:site-specific DNA-methyltransferase (adenine-specific) n=1 Tax=Jeotgalibacillus marinus TaxID=86667 RepID=A0ABV3Q5H3_9BACL
MNKTENLLTLAQTAELLDVSKATVANWVKKGVFAPVVDKRFDRSEVVRLREELMNGTSTALQSRRNKKYVTSTVIPTDYVEHNEYTGVIETLSAIVERSSINVSIVMKELSLKVLWDKGIISSAENQTPLIRSIAPDVHPAIQRVLPELFDADHSLSPEQLEVLSEIKTLTIPYFAKHEDFLGQIYQALVTLDVRKKQGSYYTPHYIMKEMIQTIDFSAFKESAMIIDPCCGSGNFLIECFHQLKQHVPSELILSDVLHGIDLDETSVMLTKVNLIICHGTLDGVPPLSIHVGNALLNEEIGFASSVVNDKKFDLVIGNPPWGYSFSKGEIEQITQLYPTMKSRQRESFSLILHKYVQRLAEDGHLFFVLPVSFLNVGAHKWIREHVITEFNLEKIVLNHKMFNHVNSPTVSVQVSNSTRRNDRVEIVSSGAVTSIDLQNIITCDYTINPEATDDLYAVVRKIEEQNDLFYLDEHTDYALGIVTGDNKQHLLDEPTERSEPIYTGKDVKPYRLAPAKKHIEFKPEAYQQIKPTSFYRVDEKLIYKFINKKLVFAYDAEQSLTLNSANIITPRIPGMEMKTILALLNSDLMQFYYMNKWSAVKVLKGNIQALPLKCPSGEQQVKLVELVEGILGARDDSVVEQLRNEIEHLITFELYGLSEEDRQVIAAFFAK